MSEKDEMIKELGKSLTMWEALKVVSLLEGSRMDDIFIFWHDPKNFSQHSDVVEFDGVGITTLARQFSDKNIKTLRETPALMDSFSRAIRYMKNVYDELIAYRDEHGHTGSRLPLGEFMQTKFWDDLYNDSKFMSQLLSKTKPSPRNVVLDENDNLVEVPVPDFNPYKIDGAPVNFTIQAMKNYCSINSSDLYKNRYLKEDFVCSAFNGIEYYPLDMWDAIEEMPKVENPKERFPRYLDFLSGKKMTYHISMSMEFVKKYVQLDEVYMTNLAKSLIYRYMKFDQRFLKLLVANEVDLKTVRIHDVEYGRSLASSYFPEDCDDKTSELPMVETVSFGCDFDCTLQLKTPIGPSANLDGYLKPVKLGHGGKEFFQCMRDILEHPGLIVVKSKKALLKSQEPSKEEIVLKEYFSRISSMKAVVDLYCSYGSRQDKEVLQVIHESRGNGWCGTLLYKHLLLYRMDHSMAVEGFDADIDRCLKQLEVMKRAVEGMVEVIDHFERWMKEHVDERQLKKMSLIQRIALLIDYRISLDPLTFVDCEEFPSIGNYAKRLVL